MNKGKMTSRDFYNSILEGVIGETEKEYAQAQLAKLDEANEKRKNKPSKASMENAPIAEQALAVLIKTGEVMTAKEIVDEIGQSTQKITAILTALIDTGEVMRVEPSKRSHPMGYKADIVAEKEEALGEVLGGTDY